MRRPLPIRFGLIAVLALAWSAPASGTSGQTGSDVPRPRFLGPDGELLPFPNDEAALEFLRTADVVQSKRVEVGITGVRKLLLERDGVRANAVFRDVAITKVMYKVPNGRFQPFFRDHYANELAAYALARALGLDTVPPTVERKIKGDPGSLQLWIEGAETEKSFRERDLPPVEQIKHDLQVDQMNIFDNLINNIDRNLGNYLTVPSGRVWWVDHTRSFSRMPKLPEEDRVKRIDQACWQRLKEMPDERIVRALEPHLDEPEIEGVLKRRRLIIELIEARLERRSVGQVLFSLDYAQPER